MTTYKPPRAEEGSYQGHATITIFTGHEYNGEPESVTLGLRKVKAVLRCVGALRELEDKWGNMGVPKP